MSGRCVNIVGGGLAGLALGRALARRGYSVELHEADRYPRHKVCGEFISGLRAAVVDRLELAEFLAPAEKLCSVRWHLRNQPLRTWQMPDAAYGLSRHRLDSALAAGFVAAGGRLHQGSRISLPPPDAAATTTEGCVQATGKTPAHRKERHRWLGLKLHLLPPFNMEADLEIHLGKHAYVGLSRIEDGRVNVCGLFNRADVRGSREGLLSRYLGKVGLTRLQQRVDNARIDPASCRAVAALDFNHDTPAVPWVRVGDSRGMIPPYTGHGMAMAFESAAVALDPLIAYLNGDIDWQRAVAAVAKAHRLHFKRRLRFARFLHSTLYKDPLQQAAAWLTRNGVLPLDTIYHLTHR